jgi:uncharacterized membrane protein YraQ (UPF0718 family)
MSYFKDLFARLCDTKGRNILDVLNDWIEKLADSMNVNSLIFFLAGAVIAAVIALFGLKLFKALTALAFGVVGSAVGSHLFLLMNDKFHWGFATQTQVTLGAIYGLLVAIVLMFLSYKAIRFMFAILMAGVGFLTSLYFWNDKYIIAAAIALGAFLVALLLHRVLLVLLTAVGGTALTFNLLSAAFPKVTYFDWNGDRIAFFIALGVALVCVLFQALTNRRKKEKKEKVEEKVEEKPEEKVEEKVEKKVEAPALKPVVWEYKKGYIIPFEFD